MGRPKIPEVNDIGDDDALGLLRFDFLGQQGRADASLDAGDLRLHQGARAIAVFFVEGIDAPFILEY